MLNLQHATPASDPLVLFGVEVHPKNCLGDIENWCNEIRTARYIISLIQPKLDQARRDMNEANRAGDGELAQLYFRDVERLAYKISFQNYWIEFYKDSLRGR